MAGTLRIVTYNIHSGLGRDGVRDFARIGKFLSAQGVDIALLQEVETRPHRGGPGPKEVLDQLAAAGHFEHVVAAPAMHAEGETWFGNVILSRYPIMGHNVVDISYAEREPRNIVDARITLPNGILRVLNTHKGLSREERYSQLEKLEDLLAQDREMPLIVGGDINEWFYKSGMLKRLNRALHPCPTAPTFPVACPVIHLDRLWCRPAQLLVRAARLRTSETRRYSDHYPVLAEFRLP